MKWFLLILVVEMTFTLGGYFISDLGGLCVICSSSMSLFSFIVNVNSKKKTQKNTPDLGESEGGPDKSDKK